MRFARSTITALVLAASSAHAITGALCISAKLNGPLKLRASGVCKPDKEIQIGSFDGTTLQFSGINVQVVSGAGTTDAAVNGRGNLIVGYNKGTIGQTRTGSHNLVVGDEHEFTSYGGFVAGKENTIAAASASVSGGSCNVAGSPSVPFGCPIVGGFAPSVSGGVQNRASGTGASVSGGASNTASGRESSVSGGNGLNQTASVGWAAGSTVTSCGVVGTFEVCNFESP